MRFSVQLIVIFTITACIDYCMNCGASVLGVYIEEGTVFGIYCLRIGKEVICGPILTND